MNPAEVMSLNVKPLPFGWAVTTGVGLGEMIFQSGAAAETAARRLAERLSRAGAPVKLTVWLRDGSLGGRFLFPPAIDPALRAAA